MNRLDPQRIVIAGLLLFSLVVLGVILRAVIDENRTWTLRIAAGARSGESYVLAEALKTVAERRHPSLRVIVRETEGTAQNLALLESGDADLATAQADVSPGPSARSVADLYGDVFQLLVRDDSGIERFPDLAGKRIALAMRGGQFQSFLTVAEHFGFARDAFRFIDTEAGDEAIRAGEADAIFWVRALGNPVLTSLVRNGKVRLVPIEQAAAMRIRTPAFEPAVIPQGAFRGNPPIPPQDTPTVLVRRTLLAREDAPARPVSWLTRTLLEDREALARTIPEEFAELRPLLREIRRPSDADGSALALHEGALQYFERDKPAYVVENADFVALILSIAVLAGTWIWELKRWIDRKQKNRADVYNRRIVDLLTRGQAITDLTALQAIREELMGVLTAAVRELDEDKISEESFQSLRGIWNIAIDALREHRAMLETGWRPGGE